MNASTRPTLFWIVAVLAVLWNLFGVFSFYYHLSATPEVVATWPAEQQTLFAAMPRWLFVPFAVATVGGLVGSLGLLWRRRWAVPMLLVSLLAIVVQFAANYLTTPMWSLTRGERPRAAGCAERASNARREAPTPTLPRKRGRELEAAADRQVAPCGIRSLPRLRGRAGVEARRTTSDQPNRCFNIAYADRSASASPPAGRPGRALSFQA